MITFGPVLGRAGVLGVTLVVVGGCLAPEPGPLVLPALAPLPAVAAAPAIGERLTLDGARAFAVARAPRLLAVRAREGIAAGSLLAARGYPTISGIEFEGAGTPDGEEWETGFTLRHRFELGGQRAWRVRAAVAALAGTRAATADARRELVADVEAAFLDALAAERLVGLAREAEETAQQLLAAAVRRRGGGDLTATDENLVRLDAAGARTRVRRAVVVRDAARARLLALLGEDDRPGLLLEGTLAGPAEVAPASQLIGRALAQRADLVVLAAAEAEADADAGLAVASRRPELGAKLGVALERFEFRGKSQTELVISTGIELDLPGFWNSGRGEVATARARAATARAERAALVREITTAVVDARRAWAAARVDAQALERDVVPLAVANLTLAQRAFEAGEADVLAVLRARADESNARRDVVEQRLREALARVALRRASGAGVTP